ncbi:MAG: TIGR04283 family arsenosugar biosynthesis glycosyltransferase [Lyngbya sp. HA4199-MV5]|nr:TIGR04283 family arsenosugar biosynthesis glycosyltransferase [Lyngbya sp. HA4199-MV5]
MTNRLISIIIPALNEAHNLPRSLQALQTISLVEVVVVDGGSWDDTISVARSYGAKVIGSPVAGRAHQMNLGAEAAHGDVLLFLHADTCLPAGFADLVRQALTQPKVIAGAFELAIEGHIPGVRLVEWGVNVRSRLCQMPYGDQAIFMSAKTFRAIGGFPALPIMEDFELMRRLKQRGRIEIVPATVLTSDRRWQKLNVCRTTLINQIIILGYLLGVSPARLAVWYRSLGKRATR